MTKSKAIKTAREQVSELYRFGDGYRFQIYNERFNGWSETYPTNYWNAQRMRSEALIQRTREALGHSDGDQYVEYYGGSWRDYV